MPDTIKISGRDIAYASGNGFASCGNTKPKTRKTKLAIIVGHNVRRPGAVSLFGLSEFEYNNQVAWEMLRMAREFGIDAKCFYRNPATSDILEIKNAYSIVNSWGADVSLELHFNSFGDSEVSGVEMLSSGSNGSMSLAFGLLDRVSHVFNIRYRYVIIPKRRARGYVNVMSGDCPAVLCEPFFGSNVGDCEKFHRPSAIKRLARTYLESVKAWEGR